jgi:hypothetical protein
MSEPRYLFGDDYAYNERLRERFGKMSVSMLAVSRI